MNRLNILILILPVILTAFKCTRNHNKSNDMISVSATEPRLTHDHVPPENPDTHLTHLPVNILSPGDYYKEEYNV